MSEEKKEMKKSSSPAKDLTVGSPMKLILGFAFPMFLGLLFQQFYSLVDTMIVGKYLGVDPFAGVGRQSEFYCHWILYGTLQWILGSDLTELWCQGFSAVAEDGDKFCVAVYIFQRCNYNSDAFVLPPGFNMDEHPGEYI